MQDTKTITITLNLEQIGILTDALTHYSDGLWHSRKETELTIRKAARAQEAGSDACWSEGSLIMFKALDDHCARVDLLRSQIEMLADLTDHDLAHEGKGYEVYLH